MALAELKPELAAALSDGRLQLHHAAQLATAAGISYLAARPDDSHTNLEWVPALGALASRSIPAGSGFRVGVRASDLTLLVTDLSTRERGAYSLNGRTMANAAAWLGGELTRAGTRSAATTKSRPMRWHAARRSTRGTPRSSPSWPSGSAMQRRCSRPARPRV